MCATKSTEEVEIHGFLADQRGTDFLGYKTSTIRRRLNEQMHKAGRTSHTRYMELLRADPVECDRLLDRLTISVSTFFRNPLVWQTLRDRVMPEILEKGDLAGRRVIRVWSAGCAQGEEAYSAAILLQQILRGGGGGDWSVRIDATDVDPKALANAEAGRFERKALENVPLGLVDRCFIEHEDDFEVRPEIRSMVRFIREDLTTVREPDAAGARSGSFQIVICRNVLIYFNREIQARIMRSLCREVGPGGYLVLGDSETLVQGGCEDLQPVGKGLRIWGRKGGLGGKGYRHG